LQSNYWIVSIERHWFFFGGANRAGSTLKPASKSTDTITRIESNQAQLSEPPSNRVSQGREQIVPRNIPLDRQIPGKILAPNQPWPLETPEVESQAAERPKTQVSRFDETVVKFPATIQIYDNGTVDGDVVRVLLNGKPVGTYTLPDNPIKVNLRLRPGVNRIQFVAVSQGSLSPTTLGITLTRDQTVQNGLVGRGVGLNPGESFAFTAGYPQIALCLSNLRFPCTGRGPTPESARHVLEARGTPPSKITAPLKRGQRGNRLRPSYPKLLTLDLSQGNRDARRAASTKAYDTCPKSSSGQNQDLDEYPPATFYENAKSAHIKCVPLSDNRRAGGVFGAQLRFYRIVPGGQFYPIDQKDTIEFVILN
jgi:hypothetical protein